MTYDDLKGAHNYKWDSGENGIIIHKCEICGAKMAVVKVKEYIKFDVKTKFK